MGEQEMRISSFGKADGKLVNVNGYRFCLKGKSMNSYYL